MISWEKEGMKKIYPKLEPFAPGEFREELRRVFKKDYGVVLTEEELTRSVENINNLVHDNLRGNKKLLS